MKSTLIWILHFFEPFAPSSKLNLHISLVRTFCSANGWQYFTTLKDLLLTGTPKDEVHVHSEYLYGNCKRIGMKFYTHVHIDHMQLLGKLIVRGWIDIPRIPTCIYMKATAYENELFRSTAYNFQLCVPRITYCHSQKRFKYFYYELYVPEDMIGGMNWDIYFYGPPDLRWQ